VEYYVNEDSIVRKIWGKSDTILFIFAGAAAEFALNKAVDWLYFTGKLPRDPIGRLFSTVSYARKIVFSEKEHAFQAIDKIVSIHGSVESSRGYSIPDWAYRDVLFMLIHYSIASFELLERKLTNTEKEEVFDVFFRMGERMGLNNLPLTFENWLTARDTHLRDDLQRTHLTNNLFGQYKKNLGDFRYRVLIEAQKLVVPKHVYQLLLFREIAWLKPAVPVYQLCKKMKLDNFVKSLLLPVEYKQEIKALDT
jgi:hypothetical protein